MLDVWAGLSCLGLRSSVKLPGSGVPCAEGCVNGRFREEMAGVGVLVRGGPGRTQVMVRGVPRLRPSRR